MADEKDPFRVEIEPELKAKFGEIHKRRGLTRTEATTRILQWFVEQPQVIQQSIFRHLPGDLELDIVQMVLREMEKKRPNHISSGS